MLRLLIITPTYLPSISGNAIRVARLVDGLRQRDITPMVISSETTSLENARQIVQSVSPNLIHAFHGFRSASLVETLAARIPYALTLTGTDVNQDLHDSLRNQVVLKMLWQATRLLVSNPWLAEPLIRLEADWASKIVVIKKAVVLQPSLRNIRNELGLHEKDILFTLPAGIRRVKNVLYGWSAIQQLREEGLPVHLLLVGPIIEPDYAQEVFRVLDQSPWAHYLGAILHTEMEALYRASDVVLNTSLSEGESNAILEALSLGRPVLTSDIPGNRALVREGENGFLCSTIEKFIHRARELTTDHRLRTQLGQTAHHQCQRIFSPEREIDEHLRIYRHILELQPF